MATKSPIYFNTPPFVADKVDEENAVIRGVSIITGGLIARGHDLEVDSTTLKQMLLCAQTKEQVPVKVDHKSGAGAVCGFLTNFRIEGDKLKGDWHLLQSHPQKLQILETALRMPRGVGLSAAFLSPDKPERTEKGKPAARCAELISVDYVTLPAANPNGMFSAIVDSPTTAMNPEQIQALIDAAVSKAVAPLTAQLDAANKQMNLMSNPPTLEQVQAMDEAQLAELGLTKADVDAAIAELAANGELDAPTSELATEGDLAPQGELVGAGAPAAPAAAAPAAVGTALAAVQKQLVELSSQFAAAKTAAEQERVETLFASVEAKVTALSNENTRLRVALEAGSRPSAPGVDRNGVRFFSTKKNEGKYEKLVQFNIEEKKMKKSEAFSAAMKDDPAAYQDYLTRLNVVQFAQ